MLKDFNISNAGRAIAAPALLLAAATTADAATYYPDNRPFWNEGFMTWEETSSFYSETMSAVSGYAVFNTGAEEVKIEGLAAEPMGQGRNNAPELSNIGVWAAEQNGERFFRVAGAPAVDVQFRPAQAVLEAVEAGNSLSEAFIVTADQAIDPENREVVKFNTPAINSRLTEVEGDGFDIEGEMTLMEGFPLAPINRPGLEADAYIELDGQYIPVDIDERNDYHLVIDDAELLERVLDQLAQQESVVVYAMSNREFDPKMARYELRSTADLTDAIVDTALNYRDEDVSVSRIPVLNVEPVEGDVPEDLMQMIAYGQCVAEPKYDVDDVVGLSQVHNATGMLTTFSQVLEMNDGTTWGAGFYRVDPDGRTFISATQQGDPAAQTCLGLHEIEITNVGQQVAQAYFGEQRTVQYGSTTTERFGGGTPLFPGNPGTPGHPWTPGTPGTPGTPETPVEPHVPAVGISETIGRYGLPLAIGALFAGGMLLRRREETSVEHNNDGPQMMA